MAEHTRHHQQKQGSDYAKEDHSAEHRGDMASRDDAVTSEAGQKGHHESR